MSEQLLGSRFVGEYHFPHRDADFRRRFFLDGNKLARREIITHDENIERRRLRQARDPLCGFLLYFLRDGFSVNDHVGIAYRPASSVNARLESKKYRCPKSFSTFEPSNRSG